MSPQSGNSNRNSIMYHSLTDTSSSSAVLNEGSEDEVVCVGYKQNVCLSMLYYVMCVLSGGILILVMHWMPHWKTMFTMSTCSLDKADVVLLKNQYKEKFVEVVQSMVIEGTKYDNQDDTADDYPESHLINRPLTRYFDHQNVRYLWSKETQMFTKLCGLDSDTTCGEFYSQFHGLSAIQQSQRSKLYGRNSIDIQVKSYVKLCFEEVLNPFYIFQLFSVILWMTDNYYYYAGCIIAISLVSVGIALYETKKQSVKLRDMVGSSCGNVTIYRGNDVYMEVSTSELVPGDVIVVPSNGCTMYCDAVLTAGNCIVNESMLTGESVPVTKTPLSYSSPEEKYSPDEHKRYTLFCGTRVIQTRYYGGEKVTAVVIRTGFLTAKGELVRAILFPKPTDFKFYQDSMRFILVLFCLSLIGMAYSFSLMLHRHEPIKVLILRTLDIITIVVPPALPAAMTVGVAYAQNRLKKQGIFCISPPRINMCGKLNVICFDKTGTLTEDGMDLWGVVPLQGNRFLPVDQHPNELPRGPFLACMATCHSLTRIDGNLTGDPLDLKMFQATNWVLDEPVTDSTNFNSLYPTTVHPITPDTLFEPINTDLLEKIQTPYEIGIVRQFVFTSTLQRMSVITRTLGENHMDLYCKGAPEKVLSLCRAETVPEDFHEVLQRYTQQGFRVIAAAWRPLDAKLSWHQAQKIPRDSVERDMFFLGLLIMQNTLKPETSPVIHKLKNANIRTVMITGDNMLTAVSVARECAMVAKKDPVILINAHGPEQDKPASIEWQYADTVADSEEDSFDEKTSCQSYHMVNLELADSKYHFAVSGKSFAILRQHFPDLMPKICIRGTIFARMKPEQKSQLVEHLQELGYTVGMCGDGANDCGALKAAHAGISLSEEEASVASPFTSQTANIECVPTVIKEGRAALVTSFGVFRYMAGYSMIQFASVLILYTSKANLADLQFLYIDLAITTTVAILMGYTGAYPRLVRARPKGSLVSPSNIFSILVNVFIVIIFQLAAFLYLYEQPWFQPVKGDMIDRPICWESTLVFCVSAYQYLILAVVFSKGPPFRKHIWSNGLYLASVIVLTGFTSILLLHPFYAMEKFFSLKHISDQHMLFKLTILMMAVGHFFLAFIFENYVVDSQIMKRCFTYIRRKKLPKSKYKIIERELLESTDWPPVGGVTVAGILASGSQSYVAYSTQ